MEFLTKVPVIGPVVVRLLASRPYLAYRYLTEARGNRLAGAVTFFGFLALFPLLTVALAIAAGVLTDSRIQELQKKISDQLPGLSDSLNLPDLVANAATIGVVSGLLLLISGLGWVDTMRSSVRDLWQLPEEPGNMLLRKGWDCLVLAGLGVVTALSLGASAVATTLAKRLADGLGLGGGAGRALLTVVGVLMAVAVDTALFAYLLGPFPRITGLRRRHLLQGALIGAVGFELLKVLLASYLGSVAGKSVYGAFGVPIALLLWINFVSRLLMYCACWTALADPAAARERARAHALAAYRAADGPAEGPAATSPAGSPPGPPKPPAENGVHPPP